MLLCWWLSTWYCPFAELSHALFCRSPMEVWDAVIQTIKDAVSAKATQPGSIG